MIFWHLGGAIAVVRYVFKDPTMDLRFLMVGALLPDLLDKPVGIWLFDDRFGSGRIYGHTLLFAVALLVVVMAATRRGTPQRKAMLPLPIGVLLHLLLDFLWTSPENFWWPLLGTEFPSQMVDGLFGVFRDQLTNPWVLAGEAVGLAYLITLFRRARLADRVRFWGFLRNGRIALPLK